MDFPMREPNAVAVGSATLNEKTQAARQQLLVQLGRLRLAWRVVLVATLVSLAGIVWLSQTSTVVSLGYQIDKIQQNETVLNRDAQILQAQVASYESPAKIEQEAKTKLGMVYPDKSHIVFVKVQPAAGQNSDAKQVENSNNPDVVQVSQWWRQLTAALPRPWQGSTPALPAGPSDK